MERMLLGTKKGSFRPKGYEEDLWPEDDRKIELYLTMEERIVGAETSFKVGGDFGRVWRDAVNARGADGERRKIIGGFTGIPAGAEGEGELRCFLCIP